MNKVKIYFPSKEETDLYFSDETALNQSFLKGYLGGLETRSFRKEEEKKELYYFENVNFLLGDYLDGYLTRGEDYIDDVYFSETIPSKPSENVMSIVQYYFDNISKVSLYEQDSEKTLLEYARNMQYRNNYGDEKLLETIRKEGAAYYSFLQRAAGKKIVSQEEKDIILSLIGKLDTSIHKEQIMKRPWEYLKEEESQEHRYEVHFQKIIYFEYKGLRCKGLIDILILKIRLDQPKVEKAHIVDLKTTGKPLFLFDQAVDMFRYDVQLAFYRTGISQTFGIYEQEIECSFLVLGKYNPMEPMLRINLHKDLLYRGKWGEDFFTLGPDIPSSASYLNVKHKKGKDMLFRFEWALRSYKYYLGKSPEDPGELVNTHGTEYTLTKQGLI